MSDGQTPASVRVELDGPINFRDLGGLAAAGGTRVRRGVLYRSDSLHRLTAADAARLVDMGIVAAIDFRAADELERFGLGTLPGTPIRHVHLPTMDVAVSEHNVELLLERPVVEFYVAMLESGANAYGGAVTAIADTATLPAVFFCFAGKDRTGIFAAMVLGLLGVSDDDIVADYTRSHEVMERRKALMAAERPGATDLYRKVPPALSGALPETMEALLVAVQDRWGGWEGYVTSVGVDAATVDALRANLLD